MKILTATAGTVLACLVAALAVLLSSPVDAQSRFEGQWVIDLNAFKPASDRVQLSLRYESERGGHNETSQPVAREQLKGLAEAQAMGGGSVVQFQIQRDAGVFNCEGWFRGGK